MPDNPDSTKAVPMLSDAAVRLSSGSTDRRKGRRQGGRERNVVGHMTTTLSEWGERGGASVSGRGTLSVPRRMGRGKANSPRRRDRREGGCRSPNQLS
jgi:hypothetical protein